jgi:L-ribulose-5-phosphate 3-epimerase
VTRVPRSDPRPCYKEGVFRLAYNTNGLSHHRLLDALELLAGLGYRGVALTPDAGQLDPYDLRPGEVARIARRAHELDLALAVETGSRFLLDPRRKHRPTLLEDDPAGRERRADFLERCVDLAAELGAGVVSIWSGSAPDGSVGDDPRVAATPDRARDGLWQRLADGVARVLARAERAGVRLAFEPEPGMFVERPAGFTELRRRLGAAGDALGLCLDVGHLIVSGDVPVDAALRRHAQELLHVHLDDARPGEHVHRMFGDGELDLAATLRALTDIGYTGLAAVELSRDAPRGAEAAAEAMQRIVTSVASFR